jgi:hypothetical protein
LVETAEHIAFISSYLPRQLTGAVNEPVVLLVVVAGFILVILSMREGRSVGSSSATLESEAGQTPAALSAFPGSRANVRPAKELNHNMQFTGAKYMPTTDSSGVVVACFQNKPIPHTPLETFRFGRVTAAFTHESGVAIGEISPVAWADSDAPTIDFDAGVTHCAAVAVFAQGQWCGCRVASVETYWGDTGYSIERPPLPAGIVRVTVTLIGAMNVSLPACNFTLDLRPDGTATVEIK